MSLIPSPTATLVAAAFQLRIFPGNLLQSPPQVPAPPVLCPSSVAVPWVPQQSLNTNRNLTYFPPSHSRTGLCSAEGAWNSVDEEGSVSSRVLSSKGVGPHLPQLLSIVLYTVIMVTSSRLLGTLCFQPKPLVKVVSSQDLLSHLCYNRPYPPPLWFRQCGVWEGSKVPDCS